MNKAQFVEDIEGLGKLYVAYGSFDIQVQSLKERGIEIPASVRDASYARLHGKSQDYTRTCHASICTKNSPVIIARVSPAIKSPKMLKTMVEAHSNSRYPVFDEDKSIYREWERIAKQDKRLNPGKARAIMLSKREDYRIHKDSEEAIFFWQDTRKEYFKQKVNGYSVPVLQIPVDVVDSTDGTIVNYVGFGRFGSGSYLDFGGRDLLSYSGGAFGMAFVKALYLVGK